MTSLAVVQISLPSFLLLLTTTVQVLAKAPWPVVAARSKVREGRSEGSKDHGVKIRHDGETECRHRRDLDLRSQLLCGSCDNDRPQGRQDLL